MSVREWAVEILSRAATKMEPKWIPVRGLSAITLTLEAETEDGSAADSLWAEPYVVKRSGKLNSQMVFQEGVVHESLYQVEFGALMISVCASRVMADICHDGGMIDLVYAIELEQSAAGTIDYHLEIRPKD